MLRHARGEKNDKARTLMNVDSLPCHDDDACEALAELVNLLFLFRSVNVPVNVPVDFSLCMVITEPHRASNTTVLKNVTAVKGR